MMKRGFPIVALSVCVALAGCGYAPLYGSSGGASNVELNLSSVHVEEQRDRLGQVVRNALISGMGQQSGAAYRLQLNVSESTSTVITYPAPRASRKAAVVVVNYRLFGSDARKALTAGRVESRVSYDITNQPFADRQARSDAEERAARDTAAEIRTRLAVFFSRRS